MKPEDAPVLEEWSTATEIALVLGISRQTTNLMIRGGEFKTLHRKGTPEKPQYFVRTEELNAMVGHRTFPRSAQSVAAAKDAETA